MQAQNNNILTENKDLKAEAKAQSAAVSKTLPDIPQKRYFTIGEVSELCQLKPHVLRYWEQEFSQLRPSKRRGNRRYYQYKDVAIAREIRSLLYEQGYTISGARQKLSATNKDESEGKKNSSVIRDTIKQLENLLTELA